jgi:hypothetical protein
MPVLASLCFFNPCIRRIINEMLRGDPIEEEEDQQPETTEEESSSSDDGGRGGNDDDDDNDNNPSPLEGGDDEPINGIMPIPNEPNPEPTEPAAENGIE